MSLSDSGATLTHPLPPPTPSPPVLPIRFTGSPNPSPSTNPIRLAGPPRSPGQPAAPPPPASSRRFSSSQIGGLLSPTQPPVRLDQSLAAAAALGDDELPIPASAADARRGVGKALEALRDRRAFMAQAQQLASPSLGSTSVHSHIDSYAPSAYSTPAVQAHVPPGSRFVPRPSNPPSPNPSLSAFSAVAPVWYDTSPPPGLDALLDSSDVADGLSDLGSDTPSVSLSALDAHYESSSSESNLDDSDSQDSNGDPGQEDTLDDDVDDDIETALATRQEQRFVSNPSRPSGLAPPIQDYSPPELAGSDKFSDVYASAFSPARPRSRASPRRRHKHTPSATARTETRRRGHTPGPRDPGPLHRLQRYLSVRFGIMDADEDGQEVSASGVLLLLILMLGTGIAIVFGLSAGLVQVFHYYRDARIESQPRPWRLHCATQPSFPHEMADTLAPVDMFVAVLSDTTPEAQQRRQLIRHTWGRLTVPQDAQGRPTGNVQVKFVLPQPSGDERGAVEMEDALYNDLALLDVAATSRRQKDAWSAQLAYPLLKWASKHAHVPVLVRSGNDTEVRWKVADYFVKTDDDTFVVLDELERHLRLAPRVRTVWGYQAEHNRVAGGTYALTTDLVEWLAKSSQAQGYQRGKEGDRLSHWLGGHPGTTVPYGSRDDPGQSVTFVSERCWMYDHPASGTPFSHGFLFPDQLRKIKDEVRYGLPASTVRARGGARQHLTYSTVTDHEGHRLRYAGYISTLTGAERAEAMVEGGGRWALSGGHKPAEGGRHMRDALLAGDARIRSTPVAQALRAGQVHTDPTTGLGTYLLRPGPGTKQMLGIEDASDSGREARIRSERFGGYHHGGTVVVRNLGPQPSVFLETTLVLLGRLRTWPDGAGGTGSAWRAT